MTSIVPCLAWVKKGAAKALPDKVQLDKAQLKALIQNDPDALEKHEDSDYSEAVDSEDGCTEASAGKKRKKDKAKSGKKKQFGHRDAEEDRINELYDLDDYDEEDSKPAESHVLAALGDIVYYASNEEDPYITLKDDEDSDAENEEIDPTDNLLVVGRWENIGDEKKELPRMAVYVYNEDKNSFYPHHEYLLPKPPLAMEWLDFRGNQEAPGNLVAVGYVDYPVIEIWDLDVMGNLEPDAILGSMEPQETPSKSKKKKKKKEVGAGHTDAVLDLSWNKNARHLLASASADSTVALWDLTTLKVLSKFTQHENVVQCCKWHPVEKEMVLSGSFDQTVKLFSFSDVKSSQSWGVKGEVEQVLWNHHNPAQFLASTDQGMVYCMDVRQEKPLFTLGAHNKPISGMCVSSQIPGLLVTTSEDKTMKVWDIQADAPTHVFSRNLKMERLHCVSCCPDAPFVFAFGGDSTAARVWDIRESAAVRKQYLNRMPSKLAQECSGDDQDVQDMEQAMDTLEMSPKEEDSDQDSVAAAAQNAHKKKRKKKKKKKTEKAEES